jgi:hypothetical protein
MEVFPHVDFYDYTKIANRKNLPANYSLTFSLAEDNDVNAIKAYKNGLNIAVVFDTKRTKRLPERFILTADKPAFSSSIPINVIDGDEHDYRPADPKGVIVGLRAKGDAIGDMSGFVRSANNV